MAAGTLLNPSRQSTAARVSIAAIQQATARTGAGGLVLARVTGCTCTWLPCLVRHVLKGVPPPHQHAVFSILGEDDIVQGQGSCRANGSGLLPGRGHEETEAPLQTTACGWMHQVLKHAQPAANPQPGPCGCSPAQWRPVRRGLATQSRLLNGRVRRQTGSCSS